MCVMNLAVSRYDNNGFYEVVTFNAVNVYFNTEIANNLHNLVILTT